MEYDREEFKKKFPHLHEELSPEEEDGTTQAGQEDTTQAGQEETDRESSRENVPSVVLYVRRAKTDNEAIDIVNYLRRRGEISEESSRTLLKQIQEKGVRSFGGQRRWGNYEAELRKKPVACDVGEEEDCSDELD